MDTDKIILRHAYLQSYAKGYTEKLIKAHKSGDTALIKFLREWYDEASEKDIYDALRGNNKNPNAKLLSETISSILKEQTATTLDMVLLEMTELAESEVNATIAAMEMKPVSINTPTVMALPILGESVKDGWINNRDRANKLVKGRIVDALQNGQEPHKALRGSKDQNFKDGAFYTRNLSVESLAPTQVNGVSSNGKSEIHTAYKITKEDYLATLDHRTCPQCSAAESNGPYPVNDGPIPPLHRRCVIGETMVIPKGDILAVTKRWYDGDTLVIRTSSGHNLTCTPNHPILTSGGFVNAGLLNVGGDVISNSVIDRPLVGVGMDAENVVSSIEELAESFFVSSEMLTVEVPVSAPDFHGDGKGSKVAIISINSLLADGFNTSFVKKPVKLLLIVRDITKNSFSSFSRLNHMLVTKWNACSSFVSRPNLVVSSFLRHLRPFKCFSFTSGSSWYSTSIKNSSDNISRYFKVLGNFIFRNARNVESDNITFGESEALCDNCSSALDGSSNSIGAYKKLASQLLDGLPLGEVFADEIVSIDVVKFSGHVYNLETSEEYYIANGIVTHNCRCVRIASGLDETRPYVNDKRRVKDIPKAERAGKIGQTKKSYEEWFDGQTETAKKDILGAGRYELYKNGDVKIKEFTNDGGSLYTVAQLDEKYSAAK